MAIFKCKMCGGTLEINNNETVAVCEYCGTKQTLPKLDDEKRVQLYDRANYFRRENEFDKAMGIYEMILSEDKEDCESYWGIVLCRYGIEYVEDPKTHKRIPTVNRAQFVSIFDDEDYRSAIKYSDGYQREIYEAEAGVIDKIQKRILEISSKEEPFDVFICYKENDRNGNRTQDSVYAQDVYTALTKEGYKVFFSRITLEDKLGSAYEPYIFAALNSARVMLVVGTEKDNFNAVWVKNEWSRYLALIKSGKEKTLIPVYKNMSPYDMPEEFQYLQSQDMGKVGSIQDIVRGVKKLIDSKTIKEQHTTETTSVIINTMLKRAQEALSNGEWQKATRCYDNVLDYDDKNETAYIGKMLAELEVKSLHELENSHKSITSNKCYVYLLENGIPETINTLKTISKKIEERIEEEKEKARIRQKAKRKKTITIVSQTVSFIAVAVAVAILFVNVIMPMQEFSDIIAISTGNKYTVCLKSNGSVVSVGENDFGQCNVESWSDIVAISAGCSHTVGLKSNGTVVAIGSNDGGKCDVSKWTDIVAVSAGNYNTVGLKSDGTVVAVGSNTNNQCSVSGWTDIVAIAAGNSHTVGLKSDGTVVAVGWNPFGQCDISDWTDIVAIAAGNSHTVGLKSDGTVVTAGSNFEGQGDVNNWTDIVAIAAGNSHTVGLKSDGTVVAVGNNVNNQCNVSSWTDIVAVAAGSNHTIGLKSNRTAVTVSDSGEEKRLIGEKKF